MESTHPVLFIVEDLHWTDPTTLEWLTLLIEQVPTVSLLAVLTSRPEFESPWGLRSPLTSIALNPFTQSQIQTLVGHVTEGKVLPAEVMQHLVEQTDGVPLFIEEMTKAILESGALHARDGHYELTGSLTSLAIPMSLRDSLMARLDRLGSAKENAQLGATLGRTFSYVLLQAVSALDDLVLWRGLVKLVEAELLDQRGNFPHATFTFKHALIQETAYESLLKRTRSEVHARIAQVLTDQFPETTEAAPELVAHHLTEAGLTAQAMDYWRRAYRLASTRSAFAEAAAHCRQELALVATLPDTPERAQQELRLQCNLGHALVACKGRSAPEVGQAFDRARALSQQVGGTPPFVLLAGLLAFYGARAEYQTARELAEQLLNMAPSMQDSAAVVWGHASLGYALFVLGELTPARVHLEQATALHDPHQHRPRGTEPLPGVASRTWTACTLWCLGYPNQALQQTLESLALAQGVAHPYSLAHALLVTTRLHQLRREVQTILERSETAINLATEREYPLIVAGVTMYRGWALAMQGQGAKGVAQIQEGLASWRTLGTEGFRPYFLALLAEAYGTMRQVDPGLHALAEALETVSTTGERWVEAELYRTQGDLLLRRSPADERQAETCFHQALAIARRQQAKSWELRAATSLARLCHDQGKRAEARDLLAPIFNWFTEGFDTFDLRCAKALLEELS